MNAKEACDAPFEEGPNPRLFPRINQLSRTSFCIAIGATLGGLYVLIGEGGGYWNISLLFLIALVLTSAFGAFCGHCACKQIRERRPHQKGVAMAVIGKIGCYICMCWGILVFLALSQQTV